MLYKNIVSLVHLFLSICIIVLYVYNKTPKFSAFSRLHHLIDFIKLGHFEKFRDRGEQKSVFSLICLLWGLNKIFSGDASRKSVGGIF